MYRKNILGLSFLIMLCIITACSSDDDNEKDNNSMPQTLSVGNAIILSEASPMGFGYFKVTGLATGQWAMTEQPTISPSFSTATFTYEITGENTAIIKCVNKQQISTGIRQWSITLQLAFKNYNSGNYELRDISLNSGTAYTTYGTFILK